MNGGLPLCSTCGAVSVLDPCRSCSATAPLPFPPPIPDLDLDAAIFAAERYGEPIPGERRR